MRLFIDQLTTEKSIYFSQQFFLPICFVSLSFGSSGHCHNFPWVCLHNELPYVSIEIKERNSLELVSRRGCTYPLPLHRFQSFWNTVPTSRFWYKVDCVWLNDKRECEFLDHGTELVQKSENCYTPFDRLYNYIWGNCPNLFLQFFSEMIKWYSDWEDVCFFNFISKYKKMWWNCLFFLLVL